MKCNIAPEIFNRRKQHKVMKQTRKERRRKKEKREKKTEKEKEKKTDFAISFP